MYKGYIYRISDKRAGPDHFLPDRCYIGQTQQSIEARWRQHKKSAADYDPSSNSRPSSAAKLYDAMRIIGLEDMQINCLQEVVCASEEDLERELNHLEDKFIKQFNSIEVGWNKVKAPKQRKAKAKAKGLNLAAAARNNNVPETSLRHRVIELGETPEDAIRHLQNLTQTVYVYKRQTYKNIAELAECDVARKAGLQRKNLERRIRKGREDRRLAEKEDPVNSLNRVYLDDAVFKPPRKPRSLPLCLPDGKILKGSIQFIFNELISMNAASKYRMPVPDNYTTIQNRLNRENTYWTPEQAFGFDVPPSFNSVKNLASEKGYKWVPQRPVKDEGSPIVLHETKEIFISRDAFCEQFPLTRDQVHDRICAGMDGDAILKYHSLRASVT